MLALMVYYVYNKERELLNMFNLEELITSKEFKEEVANYQLIELEEEPDDSETLYTYY